MIDPANCSHEEFLVEFVSLVKKVDAILNILSKQVPDPRQSTPQPPAPFPQHILDLAAKLRCPVCRSDMKARRRSKDGAIFFGCVRFPTCRGLRNETGGINEPIQPTLSVTPKEPSDGMPF